MGVRALGERGKERGGRGGRFFFSFFFLLKGRSTGMLWEGDGFILGILKERGGGFWDADRWGWA